MNMNNIRQCYILAIFLKISEDFCKYIEDISQEIIEQAVDTSNYVNIVNIYKTTDLWINLLKREYEMWIWSVKNVMKIDERRMYESNQEHIKVKNRFRIALHDSFILYINPLLMSPSVQAYILKRLNMPFDKIEIVLNYILSHATLLEGSIIMCTIIRFYHSHIPVRIDGEIFIDNNGYTYQINTEVLSYLHKSLYSFIKPQDIEDLFIRFVGIKDIIIAVTIYNPLLISLGKFFSTTELTIQTNFIIEEPMVSVSLNTLIDYLLTNDIDDRFQWLGNLNTHSVKRELNMIRIVVNEATTKDYIPSVITELLQNSIDAMHQYGKEGDISIRIGRYNNTNNYALSISDPVGILNENIPHVLVPFLSSKTAIDIELTGEMGTGFFNIYRQPFCKYVLIEIVNDENTIIVKATPIVRNDYIIDIIYDFTVNLPVEEKRTTITIVFNDMIKKEYDTLYAKAYDFISMYLTSSPYPIVFNDNRINKVYKEILTARLGSVKVGPNDILSHILTNGVPFGSLYSYLDEFIRNDFKSYVNSGIVFDISKNGYQPVHSRNRLMISDERKKELKIFIDNGLYFAIIYKILDEKLDMSSINDIIPFFSSRSDINQLTITICEDDIVNFIPTGYLSISNYINSTITYLRDISWVYDIDKINEHLKSFDPPPTDIVRQVLLEWFRKKKKPSSISYFFDKNIVFENEDRDFSYVELPKSSFISKIYTRFIYKYWEFGSSLESKGIIQGTKFSKNTSAPTFKTFMANISMLFGGGSIGYYDRINHSIGLIYSAYTKEMYSRFKTALEMYAHSIPDGILALMDTDSVGNYNLNSTLPLNPLIHELEHAWRIQSHKNVGSHDKITLTIANNSDTYTFDEAGMYIYNMAIANGLFVDFFNSIVTPLSTAIFNNNVDAVDQVLSNPGYTITEGDNIGIIYAIDNGFMDIIERLIIDDRIDLMIEDNYLLMTAIDKNYQNIIIILLSNPRVDPSYPDNFPISLAVQNDSLEIVKILMRSPKISPFDKVSAIFSAVSNNVPNMLLIINELLKSTKPDNNKINRSLLYAMVAGYPADIILRLLEDPRSDPRYELDFVIEISREYEMKALQDPRIKAIYEPLGVSYENYNGTSNKYFNTAERFNLDT